ncbi:MAG: ABC transporter ATP-binding protein [Erysipelotrichaceae bacterium]|nr:ABC transporter ATP-binding protein [Erysipelotrichaceae bacterium]
MPRNDRSRTIRSLFRHIRDYTGTLVLSILLAAVTVALQLYIPVLFGKAIDGIIEAGKVDFDIITYYLRQILIILGIVTLTSWIMNLLNNHLTYSVVEDIRKKAIRKIQILPLSYLDSHSSGDILQRVIGDVDQLSEGLLLGFTQLFSGVVTIIVTLVFMFRMDTGITLLLIVMTPVSFLVARFISSRTYEMFKKQTETRGRQTALINELVSNQKIVKAFAYEARASKRFEEINQDLRDYSQKAVFYSSLTNPSTRAVNNVIYALVALIGAMTIMKGRLSVGILSVLLSYANQYMKPFNDISSVITELQNSLACADRIFELIDAEPETKDSENTLKITDGNIEIKNVCFSYVKDRKLIEDFNLDVKEGMTVAIVGPTGCGKTTFINLLMRFYDVDKGEILIDGQDIREVSRHSLRSSYGMVLQDTWIRNATVRENIVIGKPDASEEEIIEAAKQAHSWGFIRRMPNGLDTIIDEESLSQGQKQLLCITRVMLCMPPMLILDEATSSIDTRTEILIQKAFEKLMNGRTSFIVAHRLSTIRNADIILVMKDGKIIEQGSHEQLLKQNGFYNILYHSQFAKVEE